MSLTLFYSWQSDLPAKINRNFIEDALKRALRQINADAEVINAARGDEVVLDKDTAGLPGTPPIAETIFSKIDKCEVFVPDLTFVARSAAGRLTPNANVLIEYGWALKSIGHGRIVAVMNDAFGAPTEESLPFNMRHLRWPLLYTLPDGSDSAARPNVRGELINKLAEAIRALLSNVPVEPVSRPMFERIPTGYDNAVFFQRKEPIAIRPGRTTEMDEKCFVSPQGAKMFLRLMPSVPMVEISGWQAYSIATTGRLAPFSLASINGGEWYDRNKYGSIVFRARGDDNAIDHLTQLLKNRELWGISNELDYIQKRAGFGVIPNHYEVAFIRALNNYLAFARDRLQLDPPLQLLVGITGIEGFKIAAPPGMVFGGYAATGGRAVEPDVTFETQVADWNTPSEEILKPFFEKVWNAFGLPRPETPR